MGNEYPTEADLDRVRHWRLGEMGDMGTWLDFAASLWNLDYGDVRLSDHADTVEFITGGWSGNESVLAAMQDATVLWSLSWLASFRGGLVRFRREV